MKIIAVCSGGGHMTELERSLPTLNDVFWVTTMSGHASLSSNKKFNYIVDPHKSLLLYLYNGLQSLYLLLKIKPDIVISTGAGICIPMFILSKLLGKKLIFIETGARIASTTKTGRFLYKYCDLFVVQSEGLKNFYPDAKCGLLK